MICLWLSWYKHQHRHMKPFAAFVAMQPIACLGCMQQPSVHTVSLAKREYMKSPLALHSSIHWYVSEFPFPVSESWSMCMGGHQLGCLSKAHSKQTRTSNLIMLSVTLKNNRSYPGTYWLHLVWSATKGVLHVHSYFCVYVQVFCVCEGVCVKDKQISLSNCS